MELSVHPNSKKWLWQFPTPLDRARAVELLRSLKLVSHTEFETGIKDALIKLQEQISGTIAVYPIMDPNSPPLMSDFGAPKQVIQNTGKAQKNRRGQFGSEHRVGHIIQILQRETRRKNTTSLIESIPTVHQVKTQKIKHVVFVDDIAGSGERTVSFWKSSFPKSLKSLLSYQKIQLWLVYYVISDSAKKYIEKNLPNFPISTNLVSVLPEMRLNDAFSEGVIELCNKYASTRLETCVGLGFHESFSSVVFEHGCPNNAPSILRLRSATWQPLFPNRAIPGEMQDCFVTSQVIHSDVSYPEVLWSARQQKVALQFINDIFGEKKLNPNQRVYLLLLGLLSRNVSLEKINAKLFISKRKFNEMLAILSAASLFSKDKQEVTEYGIEVLRHYKKRWQADSADRLIANSPTDYYPSQCEGESRYSGIIDGS